MEISNNEVIYEQLFNKIFREEVVLFLGSGFSLGATNVLNEPVPSVEMLKEIIITEVLAIQKDSNKYDDYYQLDLKRLSEITMKTQEAKFKDILHKNFRIKKYSEFHRLYGKVKWKSIFSLNIDNLMEKVLDDNNVLFTPIWNSKPKYISNNDLKFYKIRGTIENIEDVTFSEQSYFKSINQQDRRVRDFVESLLSDNILFIGTSLFGETDIDVSIQMESLTYGNKIYYVSPKFSEVHKEYLKTKFVNIEFIKETAESFIHKYFLSKKNVVSQRADLKDVFYNIGFNLIKKKYYFDEDYLSSNMYTGRQPSWKDIFTSHDVLIEKTKSIIDNIYIKDTQFLFIVDQAISGKTTMLYRIGAYLSGENIVLEFIGDDFRNSINSLIEFVEKDDEYKRYYILIDDSYWILSTLVSIFEKLKKFDNLFFILTLRAAQYQRLYFYFDLEKMKNYKIKVITPIKNITLEDAIGFIKKLQEKTFLGKYASMNITKAANLFLYDMNNADILKCLYEFREGIHFEVKMKEIAIEIFSSDNLIIKRFLTLLYFLDFYADTGIILKMFFKMFDVKDQKKFSQKINELLRLNILDEKLLLNVKLKSRYIRILTEGLKKIDVYERRTIIEDLLINLSINFKHYMRSNSYYYEVAKILIRQKNLVSFLKDEENRTSWKEILKLYKNISNYYNKNSLYWTNRAIAEVRCGNFDDADIHLNQLEKQSFDDNFMLVILRSIIDCQRVIDMDCSREANQDIAQQIFQNALFRLKTKMEDENCDGFAYMLYTYINESQQYYLKTKYSLSMKEATFMSDSLRKAINKFGIEKEFVQNIYYLLNHFYSNNRFVPKNAKIKLNSLKELKLFKTTIVGNYKELNILDEL